MKVRKIPLRQDQAERMMEDHGGYIEGTVAIDIDYMINNDSESFLDLLSQKLTGTELLQDISYRVVGHKSPGTIYMQVRGNPSEALEYMVKGKGPRDWSPREKS